MCRCGWCSGSLPARGLTWFATALRSVGDGRTLPCMSWLLNLLTAFVFAGAFAVGRQGFAVTTVYAAASWVRLDACCPTFTLLSRTDNIALGLHTLVSPPPPLPRPPGWVDSQQAPHRRRYQVAVASEGRAAWGVGAHQTVRAILCRSAAPPQRRSRLGRAGVRSWQWPRRLSRIM